MPKKKVGTASAQRHQPKQTSAEVRFFEAPARKLGGVESRKSIVMRGIDEAKVKLLFVLKVIGW
ncbi:hypothetical protein [Rhodopirellula baltica]|uniref:hypothetical protein n=1 Tax=Rhodopirellula baltica TaxID=265606 RepID=UPI0002F1B491|nr:hypothetical protein [Rhodopirellula baltica]